MATEIEYLDDRHLLCPPSEVEVHDVDDRLFLNEWGLEFLRTEMENWYARTHQEKTVITVTQPHVSGDELRFLRLRKEWIRGTQKISKLSQILLHPAYQQIIAMGPLAIPMILQSLERKLDHWFWALKILNQNEDVAEGEETLEAAAEAWLKWGREKGHLD